MRESPPHARARAALEFSDDAKTALVLSSLKRDTVALQRLDMKDGRLIKTLAASDACDVGGVSIDEKTKQPRAVAFTLARTERTFFDRVFAADYAWLEAAAGGAEVSFYRSTAGA
jgi:hypothetical protein